MKNTLLALVLLTSIISFGQTNVFDACRSGNLADLEKLYKEDPSVISKKNEAGYPPIILAAYHGREKVVKFLLDKNVNINEASDYGTPLMAAVVKGSETIVKLLLDKKANTDITDINGFTALHYATQFKRVEIIALLIQAGADYKLKDGKNKSSYDYALESKNKEIIKLFNN